MQRDVWSKSIQTTRWSSEEQRLCEAAPEEIIQAATQPEQDFTNRSGGIGSGSLAMEEMKIQQKAVKIIDGERDAATTVAV